MASILDLLNNPYLLAGGGLTGLSALGRDEPGYVTEARQAVRNIEQPEGYSSVFGRTVSGLQDQFLPLMKQQAEQGIADVSQRYAAAFPGSVGMQGGEIAGLNRYLRDQLVPTQQAYLGNLGITGIGQQQNAAQTILKENTDDPLRQGIATLAAAMLMKGIYGNGQGTGTGTGSDIFGQIQKLLGGGGGTPGGGIPGLPGGGGGIGDIFNSAGGVSAALSNPNLFNSIASLGTSAFGTAVMPSVAPNGIGLMFTDVATGYPAGTMGANGVMYDNFGNLLSGGAGAGTQGGGFMSGFLAPQAAGTTGWAGLTGGTGLMGAPSFGSLAGIGSGLAAGGAGYALGSMIGGQLPGGGISGQGGAALGGAGAGALAGFAIGGPIGAAIGALAGAAGGFMKSREVSHAVKAANLKADTDYQTGQSRTIADYFLPVIEQQGGDVGPLMDKVANLINTTSAPGDQQGQIAQLLGDELLRAAKVNDPGIGSLSDIPGLKESFMQFMIKNAYAAPTATSVRPLNETESARIGAMAGFGAPAGINTVNVSGYGDVSQVFENIDRTSPAEIQSLIGKIKAAGYNGPIPASISTPGRGGAVPVQQANFLVKAAREGMTLDQIKQNYSMDW